jgi:ribosome-binding protein aMBF1 (putative translation factor)
MSETETTKEQLQAEIDQTREQLGETVEQLAAKADVKARVQPKVEEAKSRAPVVLGAAAALLVAVVLVRRARS